MKKLRLYNSNITCPIYCVFKSDSPAFCHRFKSFKELLYKVLLKLKLQQSKWCSYLFGALCVTTMQQLSSKVVGQPQLTEFPSLLRYTTVDKLQQSYLFIPNKFKVMNVLLALLMNPLWTKICNEVPLIPLRL